MVLPMDIKLAATVFGVVFLAELGDKTQVATLLFSAKSPDRLITVFLGASLALVMTSAIGVLAGGFVAQYVSPKLLSYVAGAGFMLIGAWTIWQSAVAA
jgi:putative Ca2+/H+ antiporter (TMEM165/GDT1 family)